MNTERELERLADYVHLRDHYATQCADQVRLLAAAGVTEYRIAKASGLSRTTVRKWVGKDKPTEGTP